MRKIVFTPDPDNQWLTTKERIKLFFMWILGFISAVLIIKFVYL